MHRGYVALHRKITDWDWYTDSNTFRVFIHLLLTVNWEAKKWQGYLIGRGQKITSIGNLAKELNLSEQQIRTALKKLKKTNEITIKATNKNSFITLTNYESYQDLKGIATNKTTNEQQSNNKQITSKQQTNNKQVTTTKELKELETLKELEECDFEDEKNETTLTGNIGSAKVIAQWQNKLGVINSFNEIEKSAITKLDEMGCIPEDAVKARLENSRHFGKLSNDFTQRAIVTQRDIRIANAPKSIEQQLREAGITV